MGLKPRPLRKAKAFLVHNKIFDFVCQKSFLDFCAQEIRFYEFLSALGRDFQFTEKQKLFWNRKIEGFSLFRKPHDKIQRKPLGFLVLKILWILLCQKSLISEHAQKSYAFLTYPYLYTEKSEGFLVS